MKYDYDVFFEEKLKYIAAHSHKILNVGGGAPFQKIMSEHRELLAGKEYLSLDIDPGTHPSVVGDAHAMPFPDGFFDAILHVYVFEHLQDPSKAAREIFRVLKPGGYMLGIVPFIHPYHARKGGYRDYWRFSKDGLAELFKDFESIELFKIGRYFRMLIGFLPFLWRVRWVLEPVAYLFDHVFIKESRNGTAGYVVYAKR